MRGKTTDWLSVGVHDAHAVELDVRGVGHVVIVEHGIRRVTDTEGSVLDHEVGLARRGSTVRALRGPSPPARIEDDRHPPACAAQVLRPPATPTTETKISTLA